MGKVKRKIGLSDIRLKAPIGYYSEERILKNEFSIDISGTFSASHTETESLNHTLDYSQLFELCKENFSREAQLIETVAHQLLDDVLKRFPFLEEVSVVIRKINPPIQADIAHSFVELNYSKD